MLRADLCTRQGEDVTGSGLLGGRTVAARVDRGWVATRQIYGARSEMASDGSGIAVNAAVSGLAECQQDKEEV